MFGLDPETFPCFQDAKCASATYVSRAAKLGNICVCSNVSATMFPSLARPLGLDEVHEHNVVSSCERYATNCRV